MSAVRSKPVRGGVILYLVSNEEVHIEVVTLRRRGYPRIRHHSFAIESGHEFLAW